MSASPSFSQCVINASGGAISVANPLASHISVQVSGTWTGTLNFNMSIDGQNWSNTLGLVPTSGGSAVLSTTANGMWTATGGGFPTGVTFIQVEAASWTSGSATVTVSFN